MLKLGKNKAARLLALSFMFNITVAQPLCSTIAYAATRDSDYHTLDNSTSKKIQSSRDYLYTPYKSDAERQAEAEALRQQQEAAAAAQRRAAEEAAAKQSAASTDRGTSYNADGTVKELSDGDQEQQARERLQQMMKDNPRNRNQFSNAEEKNTDSLSTRVSNQLTDKDKEVLFNTFKSDVTDEKYRLMAEEVCKNSGKSNQECANNALQEQIQNCLWGELSHVEASGQEYENAKNTAMTTCLYFLQRDEQGEQSEVGFMAGIKAIYNNLNKKYEDNIPDSVKFLLGDSIAEAGVTAGLAVLSFASFGISAGALASLRAAKMGVKIASKADKVAGAVGKTTNFSGKVTSSLGKETQEALKLAEDKIYKAGSKETLKEAQILKINGFSDEKAKAAKELAEGVYGKNSEEAKLFVKATENAIKNEKKVYFNVLERNPANYAKVAAADIGVSKIVNSAGAGDYIESKLQSSEYNTEEVNKALQNEEFAKLLESKRSDAEITKIAKSVSSNAENVSTSLQIHETVEHNLAGLSNAEEINSLRSNDDNVAESIMRKKNISGETAAGINQYVSKHSKKISDGLKELGVTSEEIKEYSKGTSKQ